MSALGWVPSRGHTCPLPGMLQAQDFVAPPLFQTSQCMKISACPLSRRLDLVVCTACSRPCPLHCIIAGSRIVQKDYKRSKYLTTLVAVLQVDRGVISHNRDTCCNKHCCSARRIPSEKLLAGQCCKLGVTTAPNCPTGGPAHI